MLLRKRMAVLLSALLMMMVMAGPPAMAAQTDACGGIKCGKKLDDRVDHDKGGGNDHLKSNQGKGTTRVIGKRRLDYRGGAALHLNSILHQNYKFCTQITKFAYPIYGGEGYRFCGIMHLMHASRCASMAGCTDGFAASWPIG